MKLQKSQQQKEEIQEKPCLEEVKSNSYDFLDLVDLNLSTKSSESIIPSNNPVKRRRKFHRTKIYKQPKDNSIALELAQLKAEMLELKGNKESSIEEAIIIPDLVVPVKTEEVIKSAFKEIFEQKDSNKPNLLDLDISSNIESKKKVVKSKVQIEEPDAEEIRLLQAEVAELSKILNNSIKIKEENAKMQQIAHQRQQEQFRAQQLAQQQQMKTRKRC